ncbi:hypothetical protein GFV12_06820 [Desulfurobacterium thermolithotrophum]|uniref:hypothetical protein n=1 Tax=Desulfurobacterium thermolithotrophum TaxID=64160 RepID=UPI0013D2EE64|nr:hypothetical protein [Desulfurobacterium thermolithotrophum]
MRMLEERNKNLYEIISILTIFPLIIVFMLFYFQSLSIFYENKNFQVIKVLSLISLTVLFVFYIFLTKKQKLKIDYIIFIINYSILSTFVGIVFMQSISVTQIAYLILFIVVYILINIRDKFVKKIFEIGAYLYILFSLINILLIIKGTLPQKIIIDHLGRVRFFMGFEHVNHFTMVIYSALLSFLYLRKKILFIFTLMYLLIITNFTGTRSFIYSFFLSALILGIYKTSFLIPKIFKNVFMKIIVISIILIGTLLPLLSNFIVQNYPFIDEELTGRISIYKYSIESNFNALNLLIGGTDANADSSYMDIMGGIGIIGLILIFIYILKKVDLMLKKRKLIEVFIVLNIILAGIIEQLTAPSLLISYLFFYIIGKEK